MVTPKGKLNITCITNIIDIPPHLHCGEELQSPFPWNLDQSPSLTLQFLSWSAGLRHQSSMWQGESLSFQFNGMFAVSPSRSTPLSGAKTSEPEELKFAGKGSRIHGPRFPIGSIQCSISFICSRTFLVTHKEQSIAGFLSISFLKTALTLQCQSSTCSMPP